MRFFGGAAPFLVVAGSGLCEEELSRACLLLGSATLGRPARPPSDGPEEVDADDVVSAELDGDPPSLGWRALAPLNCALVKRLLEFDAEVLGEVSEVLPSDCLLIDVRRL